MTGVAPFKPSSARTNPAIFFPPHLRTLVAPGLCEPVVRGSGKPSILQINIALEPIENFIGPEGLNFDAQIFEKIGAKIIINSAFRTENHEAGISVES